VADRLKVGVIGLGDIARKAYLPVLAARPDLELHLLTRDRAALDRDGDAYRIPHRHDSLDDLLDADVAAAFVHAATVAHAPLVTGLLDAGRHVYVDKPLDDSYGGAERLVRLARQRDRSLMVGFNRRFAPLYAALRELPRDVVLMEKNRASLPAPPRAVVFDDFIHVVDTIRFLAPGRVEEADVQVKVVDGALHHAVLQLSGAGFTAIGIMNRMSGAAEESVEVMGGGRKRRVVDLAEVTEYGDALAVSRRGDWTPVARQRGIEQAAAAFLDAVRRGERLDADDALATHALCEQVVAACG
jgi:virulence factor